MRIRLRDRSLNSTLDRELKAIFGYLTRTAAKRQLRVADGVGESTYDRGSPG